MEESALLQHYRRDRNKLLQFLLSSPSLTKEIRTPTGPITSLPTLNFDTLSANYILDSLKSGERVVDVAEATNKYLLESKYPVTSHSRRMDTFYLVSNPDVTGSPPRRAPPPIIVHQTANATQSSRQMDFEIHENGNSATFENGSGASYTSKAAVSPVKPLQKSVEIPSLGLPSLNTGLSDDDLRESAYELLLATIFLSRTSGVEGHSVDDRKKEKSSKFLSGLKSKREKVLSQSQSLGRNTEFIDIIRVQMQISEAMDSCITRNLVQMAARRMHEQIDLPQISLGLLNGIFKSDFRHEKSYMQWKNRQANMLEECLCFSVNGLTTEHLSIRTYIAKIRDEKAWDTIMSPSERVAVLASIRQVAVNLSSLPGRFGIEGETFHWSASYHVWFSFKGFITETSLIFLNSLCKLLEPNHESASAIINDDNYSLMHMSNSVDANKTNGDNQVSRSKHSETPVKYGVSPVLAAQVERQCSSESEESSNSSDENPIITERSRNLTRSAQPRRSASPMRRVQIGRTGSRRAPALAIKSLGHYPVRDRFPFNRDEAANSCEEEGSEQISKKPEGSMRRMTVQDAINLFERRQKDESSEAQNWNSSSDHSICANKSVLRRWSSSTVECSVSSQTKDISADPVQLSGNNVADQENSYHSSEQNLERDSETTNIDVECKGMEKGAPEPVVMEIKTNATQGHEIHGISASSTEWSQQKEVELNQMLQKMMASKPGRVRKHPSSRNQNIPSKHRGGLYDHYKERRDEKLREENARKKAEKEAQFRAMQQTLDERKAEMVSRRVKDVNKKHTSPKSQNSAKNPPHVANLNKENPKASVMKKAPSKAPTVPATRKSWPSTPSSRVVGSLPSKISPGISSAGSTPTIRKPQSTSPVIKSRPKMERSQPRNNNVVGNQNDNYRSLKVTKEKKQQTLSKNEKATKTKSVPAAGDRSGKVPSKPSLYDKVTRKGSVVPLESKPFLRKGSGVASGMGPIMIKKKCSPQSEETSINSGNMMEARDVVVTKADILIIQHEDDNVVSSDYVSTAIEPEMQINCHQNSNEPVAINELIINCNDSFKENAESSAKMQSEEDSISPAVWEEIDEYQNVHVSYNNETSQLTSSAYVAPAGLTSPRVRHSLSQMLQEESSEPDTCEWGNAENPPAMAFQKDAPKGLKRLLKFARKSKGDANVTGWSSPSVFSEGEDDAEESKAICKRNTDNLLRKATLHSKNYGQQNTSVFAGYEKRIDAHETCSAESNLARFGVHNSHKLQKSNESTAASTTKATRSFFSLSAFRGTKLNESKF